MTEVAGEAIDGAPRRRALLIRWGPVLALFVAVAIVSALVLPSMRAHGDVRATAYDLDASTSTPGLQLGRRVTRNVYGLVVAGSARGKASFLVTAPGPGPGRRTLLGISAGSGSSAPTRVTLVDESGVRHPIGAAVGWVDHRLDVTDLVGRHPVRLEFAAVNSGSQPALMVDRVEASTVPSGAIPDASRWEVAAWVALLVLFVIAAAGRTRRDVVLAAGAGVLAFLVWPAVVDAASQPLASDVWDSARHASWFDLDTGLLSGTFGARSSLAVQLFHALTPITGTGAAAAGTASMLVGVGALAALYYLGRRVAGPVGGVTVLTCALLADGFRLSLSTGSSTSTLVLAAAVFLLAVHRTLIDPDRWAMVLLGAAGAFAVLADPTWWPGVVAGIALLALRYTPAGQRRRWLVTGLAVFVLVSLPSRLSVSHQSGGDVTADVTLRTTLARNFEFVGRGHTAPADEASLQADPYGGSRVGLGAYVFGDHSLSVIVGGTLNGAYYGMTAAGARTETKIAGLLAFIVELIGVMALLLLPRLRLLVLIPAMVAAVPWFLVSRGGAPLFPAQAAFWPAMLLGAATAVYTAWGLIRSRLEGSPVAGAFTARVSALRRPHRSPQPS
jgi:hypothetical protein